MEDAEESNGFMEDDDPRGRPLSLGDAVPPVRWPLSLIAGVCCGVVAIWEWVSSAPSWLTAGASVTAAAWLVFGFVRFTRARCGRADSSDVPHRDDG